MSIELIIGPMFSGKSSELIRRIRQMKVINYKYIVIKPKMDFRYETNKIVTHDKDCEECCLLTDDLNDITDDDIRPYNSIIIDEGQFIRGLKNRVLFWCENMNKNIIIGGLDGDYQRKPLGEILDLIPFATDYKKLFALCKNCNDGTHAIFTQRIVNNHDQILIGSQDIYIPLCRKCYIHFL
jgi:thymidine kinase